VDIDAPPFPGQLRVDLSPGVQAMAFVFSGPVVSDARIFGADGVLLHRLSLSPAQKVYLEFADAVELRITGLGARLEQFRTLDAFKDPGAHWETIAEIAFDQGLDAPLADVAARFPSASVLTSAKWQDLQELAQDARTWSPPNPGAPRETTPFEGIELLTSLRWAYAVVAGLGFCDGPHPGTSHLDTVRDVLRQAPTEDLLYRVVPVSPDKAYQPSNLVPVRRGLAPALAAPVPPVFLSAEVRLRSDKPAPTESMLAAIAGFAPFERRLAFSVRAKLQWSVPDPRALGVEIEEEHDASSIAGAPATATRYLCRSLSPTDSVALAVQPRDFEVAFPDVRVRASAKAFDAWDRFSPPSPPGAWMPLQLRHAPVGPVIEGADYSGGAVQMELASWSPDPIVRATGGMLEILRQSAAPRSAPVMVTAVVPVLQSPGDFEAMFAGSLMDAADFDGGSFSASTVALPITTISASRMRFRLPNADAGLIPSPGLFMIKQSPHFAGLWSLVHSIPAQEVPLSLNFSDPVPVSSNTTALTYATRVRYWGARRGPIGGLGQALVHRAPVLVPPPFEVTILSVDFFGRALVRLRLNAPIVDGRFLVFVADGNYDCADADQAKDLAQVVEPGLFPARAPMGGTDLFDLLNLPLLRTQASDVTIAIQRVGDSGGGSDFSAVQVTVPPLMGET
jgi:hypothetical protein